MTRVNSKDEMSIAYEAGSKTRAPVTSSPAPGSRWGSQSLARTSQDASTYGDQAGDDTRREGEEQRRPHRRGHRAHGGIVPPDLRVSRLRQVHRGRPSVRRIALALEPRAEPD